MYRKNMISGLKHGVNGNGMVVLSAGFPFLKFTLKFQSMKILIYTNWQIGFLISFGFNYERRFYISIDMPFFWIQVLTFKINK